ncbi:uncharacterized protein LOC135484726 [Lineus longissimus]|uniref:uncharacterized protein LOC135484726 n=1 Tax=Lineus longissimus TaxID=88925 RepID=UPI002B4CD0EE
MKWLVTVACLLLTGIKGYTLDGRLSDPESPSVAIDPECVALAEHGVCEFYECFFERYRCHDFLLADAKTICMKLQDRKDRLTEPGKKWVHDTEVCLQTALVQNYTSNNSIECAAFRQYGFRQHTKCSIDNGVCNIFWDNKFTLTGVLDMHNLSHIRHTLSVLWQCSQSRLGSWLEQLVRVKQFFTGSDSK